MAIGKVQNLTLSGAPVGRLDSASAGRTASSAPSTKTGTVSSFADRLAQGDFTSLFLGVQKPGGETRSESHNPKFQNPYANRSLNLKS